MTITFIYLLTFLLSCAAVAGPVVVSQDLAPLSPGGAVSDEGLEDAAGGRFCLGFGVAGGEVEGEDFLLPPFLSSIKICSFRLFFTIIIITFAMKNPY